MPTINLGQVQAMKVSASAPSNTTMLWNNTSDNKIYYYDNGVGSWQELADSTASSMRVNSASLVAGDNTVTFSSPLPSASYQVIIYDSTGDVGATLVSKAAASFVVNALEPGDIIYHAILNT